MLQNIYLDWLRALAYGTLCLSGVHSIVFALVTGLVYRSNIRGYAPAGMCGMIVMCLASVLLARHLSGLAKQQRRSISSYVLAGLLSVPFAVVLFGVYSRLWLPLILEFGWRFDLVISVLFGLACLMAAARLRKWSLRAPTPERAARRQAPSGI